MSESLEMYLITIAQLSEASGDSTISLSQLAKALSVQPVSVHQMIRKIAEKGLAEYKPYKGVNLKAKGWEQARQVLRKRRLWQVFLVEKLNMSLADADAFSCRLEHITPDDVAERLSEFLGYPTISPLGKLIPTPQTEAAISVTARLSALAAGQGSKVVRIDAEPAVRAFLSGQGIRPNAEVTVLAVSEGGTLLLQTKDRQITLAGAIADKIAIEEPKSSELATSTTFKEEKDPMSTKQIPLSELPQGKRGIVVKINAQGALKRRLLDMGLVSGAIITLERVAPMGDPVEFTVKGYHLSLRKKEAEQVIVEAEDEG